MISETPEQPSACWRTRLSGSCSPGYRWGHGGAGGHASREKGRLVGLALFDTNALPGDESARVQRYAVRDRLAPVDRFDDIPVASWSWMVHPSAIALGSADMEAMTPAVGPERYRRQEAVIDRYDLQSVLPTIRCPTLVAVGADDRMTPLAMARAIADAVIGENLVVIPDCRHLPPLEKPGEIAAILRDSLSRVLSTSPRAT